MSDETTTVCSACGAANSVGSHFCNQCGAALGAVCPACGTANPSKSRFCNQCATAIVTGAPVVDVAPKGPLAPPAASALVASVATPAMSPIVGDEERRLVTVVFADIVGFTGLAERLDPEVVHDVTAACFGRLVEGIVQRGGTVDHHEHHSNYP